MLKKIILIVALFLSPLLAESAEQPKPEQAYSLFYPTIIEYAMFSQLDDSLLKQMGTPKQIGDWYLEDSDREHYKIVRNDEFEYDDAKMVAYERLISNRKLSRDFMKDKLFYVVLNSSFDKYDFETESFSIKLIDNDSVYSINAQGGDPQHRKTFKSFQWVYLAATMR